MSDIRNCKSCGKMYQYINREICQECIKTEVDDFKRVKEYLYEHRGASMVEVSKALDINTKKLIRYLREGRLEIDGPEGTNLLLDCVSCGKSIRTGKYCETCENELKSNIKGVLGASKVDEAQKNDEKKKSSGMRYLNKSNK